MAQPLFQLGSFQFDLPNGVPQTLERSADYRWEEQGRILREPAYQFVGPGHQEITLDGVLYPGFSGKGSTMETLRTLAAKGEPQMLTDGIGRVYGKWAITSLREGLAVFAPGGGARQITFSVRLARYGEDNPGAAAAPSSVSLGSSAFNPFTANYDLGLGFRVDGSAFANTAFARELPNAFPVLAAATKTAGFSLGQLANIARSVGNKDYVGAALGAFGIAGLNVDQSNVWTQLGLNTAGILQSMAQGKGAPSMAVMLEALRPVTYQTMETLGGSVGGANGIRNLIRDAATITSVLDVDPHVTTAVRQVVQGVTVLSSRFAIVP